MNPLLDFSGLPKFAEIRPEHVTPAIEQLLNESQQLVERLLADTAEPSWENFIQPLDSGLERLSRAWGQVAHLHHVVSKPELRDAYNAIGLHSVAVREGPANLVATLRTPRGAVTLESKGI